MPFSTTKNCIQILQILQKLHSNTEDMPKIIFDILWFSYFILIFGITAPLTNYFKNDARKCKNLLQALKNPSKNQMSKSSQFDLNLFPAAPLRLGLRQMEVKLRKLSKNIWLLDKEHHMCRNLHSFSIIERKWKSAGVNPLKDYFCLH